MPNKRYPYEENAGLQPYQKNRQAPSVPSIGVQKSDSGMLGDDFSDDLFAVPGNPDKAILGGDNRTDLGLHAIKGNPPAGGVFSREYDWEGDDPLFAVEHNPSPSELKNMFRGGSDHLGCA